MTDQRAHGIESPRIQVQAELLADFSLAIQVLNSLSVHSVGSDFVSNHVGVEGVSFVLLFGPGYPQRSKVHFEIGFPLRLNGLIRVEDVACGSEIDLSGLFFGIAFIFFVFPSFQVFLEHHIVSIDVLQIKESVSLLDRRKHEVLEAVGASLLGSRGLVLGELEKKVCLPELREGKLDFVFNQHFPLLVEHPELHFLVGKHQVVPDHCEVRNSVGEDFESVFELQNVLGALNALHSDGVFGGVFEGNLEVFVELIFYLQSVQLDVVLTQGTKPEYGDSVEVDQEEGLVDIIVLEEIEAIRGLA